jgi:hypothetical protein
MCGRMRIDSAIRCAGCLASHRCHTLSLLLFRRLRSRFRRDYRGRFPLLALYRGRLLGLLLEHLPKKGIEFVSFNLHGFTIRPKDECIQCATRLVRRDEQYPTMTQGSIESLGFVVHHRRGRWGEASENRYPGISLPDRNRPPLRGGLFIFGGAPFRHSLGLSTKAQDSDASAYIQRPLRLEYLCAPFRRPDPLN